MLRQLVQRTKVANNTLRIAYDTKSMGSLPCMPACLQYTLFFVLPNYSTLAPIRCGWPLLASFIHSRKCSMLINSSVQLLFLNAHDSCHDRCSIGDCQTLLEFLISLNVLLDTYMTRV